MKVLWVTSDVLESFFSLVKGNPSKGSTCVGALYEELKKYNFIEFGVLTPIKNGVEQKIVHNNTAYYTIPLIKKSNYNFSKKEIKNFISIINDFNPDIIHIQGTEKYFGLITKYISPSIPVVCSIQGIVSKCIPYYKFSFINLNLNRFKSFKNYFFYGGMNWNLNNWLKYSIKEKDIFLKNKYFIGRTLWDKAQLLDLNPNAKYFHGEELLRNEFYISNWDINKCNKESIFFSSASYSLKGFHILLKAIILLKQKYPNIIVNVPLAKINKVLTIKDQLFGEDYSLFLGYIIRKFKLENNVNFFSCLNSLEMAKQFTSNHIFVMASFIENSPNALCEAMAVGTPTICSFVGGIGSLVNNEENTLMFPSGDYNLLALQIDRIFSDDKLALKLSLNSKYTAKIRHDKDSVSLQYINIYETIISTHN
jgi:glycosyltransferase involved in cell wall biosynthesis